jgi:hypothetical protein
MKKTNTENLSEPERIALGINQCLRYQLAQAKRRLRRLKSDKTPPKGRYQLLVTTPLQ